MTVMTLMAGLWLFTYENPEYWSVEVREVTDTYAESVSVDTVEHAYRAFPLRLNAYRQQVSYSAAPLRAPEWPFALGFGVMALTWSLLLAAASEIRSRWAWLFFLLFGFWLHSTGVSALLLPDPLWGRVLEFGLILAFTGLAYLFQVNVLKAGVGLRFALFLGLSALLFGLAYGQEGELVWRAMSGNAFIYSMVLSLVMIFFVSKDPNNLVLYLATNRSERSQRLRAPFVWLGLGLLMALELLWLDYYLGWKLLLQEEPGLRPLHLIWLAALLTPFLSQNQFHKVRDVFSSAGIFALMLALWPVLAFSFWWMFLLAYDPVLSYGLDRWAAITLAGVGAGYLLYLALNHQPLLRQRINLYYLLGDGPRVGFAVVWLLGLSVWVFAEGSESWKSTRLFTHSYALQLGDEFLQAQRNEDARLHYEIAARSVPNSPKANYNLASLLLSDPQSLPEAVERYQQAGPIFAFPYGYLNAASLLQLNNQPDDAQFVLKQGLERFPQQPELWNNLGNLYLSAEQPDAAIHAYQQALQAELDHSAIYSNLAQLYWQYERPEEARAFFEAGLQSPAPSQALLLSGIWYQLASGHALDLPPARAVPDRGPLLNYNYQLLQLNGQDSTGQGQLKALAREGQAPDAALLDGYLMLADKDSLEFAISRLEYLAASTERYAAPAHFLMGLQYYRMGLPEMARPHFAQQAEAGQPLGRLYAAKMDIDLGRQEKAFGDLSELRAEQEQLLDACTKEIAMLLQANGQPVYAQAQYDLSQLSYAERLRMGRYADSLQYFSTALGTFQDLLAEDSTRILPYLEMGRIYNRYCDSLALVNLRFGLEKAPQAPALNLAYEEALLCAGELDQADARLASVEPSDTLAAWRLRLRSRLAWQRGDSTKAVEQLAARAAAQPYERETILLLAEYLWQQRDLTALNQLMSEALQLNDQHPDLWYYYALVSRALGAEQDAAYGAEQARQLAVSQDQRERITQAFAELLP